MSHDADIVRLQHMAEAIQEILEFVQGRDLPFIRTNRPLQRLIVRDLEILGEARLAEKVERFRSDLLRMEGEQALYAGLLEALGYSKNKRPFLELACRAPLKD